MGSKGERFLLCMFMCLCLVRCGLAGASAAEGGICAQCCSVPRWDCICSVAHTRACWFVCPAAPHPLLLTHGVSLPLHLRSAPCLLCLPLQLVEVGAHNSRGTSINRASVEGSNDLRPGLDGFRPLDATVVEVRACAGHWWPWGTALSLADGMGDRCLDSTGAAIGSAKSKEQTMPFRWLQADCCACVRACMCVCVPCPRAVPTLPTLTKINRFARTT